MWIFFRWHPQRGLLLHCPFQGILNSPHHAIVSVFSFCHGHEVSSLGLAFRILSKQVTLCLCRCSIRQGALNKMNSEKYDCEDTQQLLNHLSTTKSLLPLIQNGATASRRTIRRTLFAYRSWNVFINYVVVRDVLIGWDLVLSLIG